MKLMLYVVALLKNRDRQIYTCYKKWWHMSDKSEHHIQGYIETMSEKYAISPEKSEEDIVAFIKVIEDASSYLFSLNHSQPYSYEGYVSGYLRTYYPLEFLTTALNINADKEEKTKALISYALKCGIQIKSRNSDILVQAISSIKNPTQFIKGLVL